MKLCKDCKHYGGETNGVLAPRFTCLHPELVHPVTGRAASADVQRSDDLGRCGRAAVYFVSSTPPGAGHD